MRKDQEYQMEQKNKVKKMMKQSVPQIGKLAKTLSLEHKRSMIAPSYTDSYRESQKILKQNLHIILCKQSFMSLSKQSKSNFKPLIHSNKAIQQNESFIRIMGCMENQEELSQLWAITPFRLYKNTFTITHIQSGLGLRVVGDKIVLQEKKVADGFSYTIQPKKNHKSLHQNAVFIRSLSNNIRKALALKGVLTLVQPNDQDTSQQFYLKTVGMYQSVKLADTFILSNPQDKHKGEFCLGVNVDTQKICYRQMHNSFDDRWFFLPPEVFKNKKNQISRQKNIFKQSGHPNKQKSSIFMQLKQQTNIKKQAIKNQFQKNQYKRLSRQSSLTNNNCQIYSFQLNKYLSIKQEGIHQRLVFIEGPIKAHDKLADLDVTNKEWMIQSDGYCMKIRHQGKGLYLGLLQDNQVGLIIEPQYWEVYGTQ